MLTFPNIDPVIFHIGPYFAVRWYSLAYVAGIVLGCLYADWLNRRPPTVKQLKIFDDFLVWAVIGIILGGRLGYVLFYNATYYSSYPLEILYVWKGGMSFHGGFMGLLLAGYLFCQKYNIAILKLADLMACAAPIGLFFGRIANFINGELYGRVTTSPFGMVFPNGGPNPRHPSQLYQASLEGLLLFILLFIAVYFTSAKRKPGTLSAFFLCGYAIMRIIAECFREPDDQIGFLWNNVTMGQLLSIPMFLIGVILFFYCRKSQKNDT